MSRKNICEVENCEDEVVYKSLGLCAACYSGIRYWRDRSAVDVLKRRRQIARLDGRMSNMQPWLKVLRKKQKEREQAINAKLRNAKRVAQSLKSVKVKSS